MRRARCLEHVVSVRHGAPDRLCCGDERIASIMRTPYYTVRTQRRVISIHSTNQLVMKGDVDVRGGKTGFISKAGYCLATLLRLPQTNQQVAVVVLGASSNAGRFMETRHLFNWLSSKTKDLWHRPRQRQPKSQPRPYSRRTELTVDRSRQPSVTGCAAAGNPSDSLRYGSNGRRLTIRVPTRHTPAGLPQRRVAASRWCRLQASPDALCLAHRTPSGTSGRRCTRTPDSGRPCWRRT